MIERDFERLSLRIGLTIDSIARDLNERGTICALSPWQPKDGCLLTIRKSGLPTEEHLSGSFALKNDSGQAVVRIEIADRRIPPGAPRVEQVPATEITPDTIQARITKFVDEWLAGPLAATAIINDDAP